MTTYTTLASMATNNTSTTNTCGHLLILLNLPQNAVITLNGKCQALATIPISAKEYTATTSLAISHLPRHHEDDASLITLCSVQQQPQQNNQHCVNHGLLIYNSSNSRSNNLVVARRWDARIEELSSDDVSDSELCQKIAAHVLLQQQESNSHASLMHGVRVVSYEQFMMTCENNKNNTEMEFDAAVAWKQSVNFIGPSVLKLFDVTSGDKIIAGGCSASLLGAADEYHDEYDDLRADDDAKKTVQDGIELQYHPIPCVQQTQCDDHPSNMHMILRHPGTKRYLSRLTPMERSALLFDDCKSSSSNRRDSSTSMSCSITITCASLLEDVLHRVYADRYTDMLGDLQLAFCVFLNMSCLASFEHWRDLVALLCFACSAPYNHNGTRSEYETKTTSCSTCIVHQRPKLYSSFLDVLWVQLQAIDGDFFHEVEYSADNFLIPALRCLVYSYVATSSPSSSSSSSLSNSNTIAYAGAKRVVELMSARFNIDILLPREVHDAHAAAAAADDYDSGENGNCIRDGNEAAKPDVSMSDDDGEIMEDDDDDNDDGPVVVPLAEVEASLSRSAAAENFAARRKHDQFGHDTTDHTLHQKYPLLYSSISPKEDVVMACARILDDKRDASLVREASLYLEDVHVVTASAGNE